MKTNTKLTAQVKKKKNGFTLIEVIAVLVLLGILAAVAVPRYVDMSANARDRAIDAGIAELNGREALVWGDTSLEAGGFTNDADIVATVSTDLGGEYNTAGLGATGGDLIFQTSTTVTLSRTAATSTSPGVWSR